MEIGDVARVVPITTPPTQPPIIICTVKLRDSYKTKYAEQDLQDVMNWPYWEDAQFAKKFTFAKRTYTDAYMWKAQYTKTTRVLSGQYNEDHYFLPIPCRVYDR